MFLCDTVSMVQFCLCVLPAPYNLTAFAFGSVFDCFIGSYDHFWYLSFKMSLTCLQDWDQTYRSSHIQTHHHITTAWPPVYNWKRADACFASLLQSLQTPCRDRPSRQMVMFWPLLAPSQVCYRASRPLIHPSRSLDAGYKESFLILQKCLLILANVLTVVTELVFWCVFIRYWILGLLCGGQHDAVHLLCSAVCVAVSFTFIPLRLFLGCLATIFT